MSVRERLKEKLTIITELLDEREKYMNEHPDIEYEDEFPTPLYIMNVAIHLPQTNLGEIVEKRKTMSLDDMVLYFEKQNPIITKMCKFTPI